MATFQYMFGEFIGTTHRWFAWFPVRTFDGRWVWLCTVNRKRVQLHSYLSGGPDQWWAYWIGPGSGH